MDYNIFTCLQYVTPSNKCVLCVEFYKVLEGKGYNTVLHNSIKKFYSIPFLYINKWMEFKMVDSFSDGKANHFQVKYTAGQLPPSWTATILDTNVKVKCWQIF